MITPEQIAKALGVPLSRVQANWPRIDVCLLALCGDSYTDNVRLAALATIRVECPPFAPIHEYGTDAQHEKVYGHRANLGNANDGDGARYAGRGYIQITGEVNYAHYGKLLGIDLLDNPADPNDDDDPNKALEPDVAAAILAAYFHEHHCDVAANASNWIRVRELVNGGHNGLKAFLTYIQLLAGEANLPDIKASAAAQLQQVKDAEAKAASAGA